MKDASIRKTDTSILLEVNRDNLLEEQRELARHARWLILGDKQNSSNTSSTQQQHQEAGSPLLDELFNRLERYNNKMINPLQRSRLHAIQLFLQNGDNDFSVTTSMGDILRANNAVQQAERAAIEAKKKQTMRCVILGLGFMLFMILRSVSFG